MPSRYQWCRNPILESPGLVQVTEAVRPPGLIGSAEAAVDEIDGNQAVKLII